VQYTVIVRSTDAGATSAPGFDVAIDQGIRAMKTSAHTAILFLAMNVAAIGQAQTTLVAYHLIRTNINTL
jgi:hypothetical protein